MAVVRAADHELAAALAAILGADPGELAGAPDMRDVRPDMRDVRLGSRAARLPLEAMPNQHSKSEPSGNPASANAPRYVDDRTLERETGGVLRRATLQKMRREGRGPATYRFSRRVYYRLDEVIAWIESHRVAMSAAAGAES